MTQARFIGWKFIHPDLNVSEEAEAGAPPQGSGLGLTTRASVELVTNDDDVRQAVLMLLSTRPGERVMRPDYGCNLNQLVFAPNDATTAGIAIYLVRKSLTQWEPRIDILTLDANPDPRDPSVLVISLKYQVRTTKTTEDIQLSLNLAGEVS